MLKLNNCHLCRNTTTLSISLNYTQILQLVNFFLWIGVILNREGPGLAEGMVENLSSFHVGLLNLGDTLTTVMITILCTTSISVFLHVMSMVTVFKDSRLMWMVGICFLHDLKLISKACVMDLVNHSCIFDYISMYYLSICKTILSKYSNP